MKQDAQYHAAILITNFSSDRRTSSEFSPLSVAGYDREHATKSMLTASESDSERVRRYAIYALGELGDDRSKKGLEARLGGS